MSYRPQLDEYQFDEAASALQKSVRRGCEEEAVYWAFVLEEGGYPWYVWKRLRVIAVEDCAGLAIFPYVSECFRMYEYLYKERQKNGGKGQPDHQLMLVAAVLELCRVQKSRVHDDAYMALHHRFEHGWHLEVPDYAKDQHTAAGRRLGRNQVDFLHEGSQLANEDESIVNPYRQMWGDRVLGQVQGVQESLPEV